jgi:alpha-1,3/alpha-1,6-mannosyltransferase
VELAISALARLQFLVDEATFNGVHLIVAGGYDSRVPENVGYYDELAGHATKLGLLGDETVPDLSHVLPNFPQGKGTNVLGYEQIQSGRHVSFVRSFTDEQKAVLLQKCSAVIYTPSNEHFGIVPLEAMAASRPVIAVNNGGPLESIVDGHTGFLRPAQAQVCAMCELLLMPA